VRKDGGVAVTAPSRLPGSIPNEGADAGQFSTKFQRASGSFDEAAQGGEVHIRLPLNLNLRRLLDSKVLSNLYLTAFGHLAQCFESLDFAVKFGRAGLDTLSATLRKARRRG